MTNQVFLKVIWNSFSSFLRSGTSRSTQKLIPLHGCIATDLANLLGEDYSVYSIGYGNNKENKIQGRYIDKKVDIVIEKDKKTIGGIAVKFVMQNYSQNSNNYFEGMLGETANIRSNNFPYFQVFIILDKLPYYSKNKKIKRWETFSSHNAKKYITLSNDDVNLFLHTPNKTLIFIVHIPDNENLKTNEEYLLHYKNLKFDMQISSITLENIGSSVIVNDYTKFINKVFHTIKSI